MSRLSAAILVLAFATPLGGQDPAGAHPEGQAVVVGETITIRSEIPGEDRPVHVPLPSDYDVEPDTHYTHYPVIYQLDGEAPGAFTYVAGLVESGPDIRRVTGPDSPVGRLEHDADWKVRAPSLSTRQAIGLTSIRRGR